MVTTPTAADNIGAMSALSSFGPDGKKSIPVTPNTTMAGNFFSQQSNRLSHNLGVQAQYRTGNILLH